MRHSLVRELLPDYIRGVLNQNEAAQIEKELETSESLQNEAEILRLYYKSIDLLEKAKASDTFLNNIHKRIEQTPLSTGIIKSLFLPFHIKVPIELAGLAVTVILIILFYNPFDSKNLSRDVLDKSVRQIEKSSAAPGVLKESETALKTGEIIEKTPKVDKGAVQISALKRYKKSAEMPKKAKSEFKIADIKEGSGQNNLARLKSLGGVFSDKKGLASLSSAGSASLKSTESQAPLLSEMKHTPAMAPDKNHINEEELYAEKIIARADSIVLQKKQAKYKVADIGLLALSVPGQPVVYTRPASDIKVESEKSKKLRKRREQKPSSSIGYLAESQVAAARPEPSPAPTVFTQIENTIKNHNGTYTIPKDQIHSPNKRVYIIEILRKDFPSLKKSLEAHGRLLDKDITTVSETAQFVKFRLEINIEQK